MGRPPTKEGERMLIPYFTAFSNSVTCTNCSTLFFSLALPTDAEDVLFGNVKPKLQATTA